MRHVLHLITNSGDSLALDVIAAQQTLPDTSLKTVDLTAREPDYRALLEEIFRADSIEVW